MSSFFVLRVKDSQRTVMVTIDENVYYHLGQNLLHGITYYNTQHYADVLLKAQPQLAPLPEYFYQPLFKHPPLFPFLVSASILLFGDQFFSGVYVSALSGSLIILLGYLIASLFFGRGAALIVAILLWMDPVLVICSQKLWMDTTLAFFSLSALLFYAYGFRTGKDAFFWAGGTACGLAALTKPTGFLPIIVVFLTAWVSRKEALRNKRFLFSLFVPGLMFLPWLAWNLNVYGLDYVFQYEEFMGLISNPKVWVLLLILWVQFLVVKRLRSQRHTDKKYFSKQEETFRSSLRIGIIWMGFAFGLLVAPSVLRNLNLQHLPSTSWGRGRVIEPLFYFRQLTEFSLFYLLAFSSFFFYDSRRTIEAGLLNMACAGILIFYLLWGNYQSRYILAVTPLFLILGVRFWLELFQKTEFSQTVIIRRSVRLLLIFLFIWSVGKTMFINFLISYPNDLCYF